jgi:DNA-directed RNA polymerase subunit RPC12/RpoP
MRRRWGSAQDDPGWTARVERPVADPEHGGRRLITESMKGSFLAKESIVDCPDPGCRGLFLTDKRAIERHGSGARVVLHCTRRPEEHDITLALDPYSSEEQETLKSVLLRGEAPVCSRCGSELELGSTESPQPWAKAADAQQAYHCPWCGVRWVPPVGLKLRAG